tara:strand:+ start:5874 stop:6392 length:519 start_codon:yes stop_codon:yes gene_type:complete
MNGIDYELESSEGDFRKNSNWRQTLQTLQDEDAVNFSIKVIEALEHIMEEHNSSYENKVSLKQLKKVYRRAAGNVFAEVPEVENDKGKWAMARVQMYLRILRGDPMPRETLASSSLNSQQEVDLFDLVIPSEQDFSNAQKCIVAHDLSHKFASIDELYLEDEDSSESYYFLD